MRGTGWLHLYLLNPFDFFVRQPVALCIGVLRGCRYVVCERERQAIYLIFRREVTQQVSQPVILDLFITPRLDLIHRRGQLRRHSEHQPILSYWG